LFLILFCSLFIPDGYLYFIALFYTFSLTIKETLNTAFVARNQYLKKIGYNLLELILSLPVFLVIYFISNKHNFSSNEILIAAILSLLVIVKFVSTFFFTRTSDLIKIF